MAASAKGTLKLTNFYKPARCVLITVNYKHFDNKHTHYIYSNEYFDTKIIGLLKPQTDHFKSSYQQLKRLFYQYQCFILITFENVNLLLQSTLNYFEPHNIFGIMKLFAKF